MERRTEDFFDGDELNISKVMQHFSQHPDKIDQIVEYIAGKIEHFTEFNVKKEHLKEKYDHKLNELYAEYMRE